MTKQAVEKPLLIICGLAVLINFLDVWWSAYLFIISFSSLAFFYGAFSILPNNEKLNYRSFIKICSLIEIVKSFVSYLGGLSLAFLVIGIMGKIQIFQRVNEGLKIYIILGSILLIISLIKKNRWLAFRLAFYLVLAGILYITSFETIIELKYRNHPEYKKEVYENLEKAKELRR